MKKILAVAFLLTVTGIAKAQCNCQQINRSDGTQVTQCEPKIVAYDNSTQVGVAAASNGMDDFITITVRFKSSSKKIKSNLSVRLESNDMITLKMVNSQLTYIGNSEVAQAIYQIDNPSLNKLSSSKIQTLSFEIRKDMISTYQTKMNKGILMKQLKCI